MSLGQKIAFISLLLVGTYQANAANYAGLPLKVGDSVSGADLESREIFWLNELTAFSVERYIGKRQLNYQQQSSLAWNLYSYSQSARFATNTKWFSPLASAVIKKARECQSLHTKGGFPESDCLDQLMKNMYAYGEKVSKAKYFIGEMYSISHSYDRTSQNYHLLSNGFPQGACGPRGGVCFRENETPHKFGHELDYICMQSGAYAYQVDFNIPENVLRSIGNTQWILYPVSLYEVTGPFKTSDPGQNCGFKSTNVVFEGTMKYRNVIFLDAKNPNLISHIPDQVTITGGYPKK